MAEKRKRFRFSPEIIKTTNQVSIPGMNNSGGQKLREEGIRRQQQQERAKREREERIASRMEMRPTLKKKLLLEKK